MKKLILAAAAAAFISAPALAHEGPYAGFISGYEHLETAAAGEALKEDGAVVGVIAGYDKHIGKNITVGLEAEFSDSSVNFNLEEQIVTLRTGRDVYAGARLGYHVSKNTLVYAKAGYTNSQLKIVMMEDATNMRFSDNTNGYRLGAGVEQTYGQYAVRLEYRYSDHGASKLFSIPNTGSERHQVVFGITTKI